MEMTMCYPLAKLLSLVAVALAVLGQSANPVSAQTRPKAPLPRAKAQQDVFTLENFQILRTRARHEDTVHVTFSVKVGDKVYKVPSKRIGDRNDGTYPLNYVLGPITVPSPD